MRLRSETTWILIGLALVLAACRSIGRDRIGDPKAPVAPAAPMDAKGEMASVFEYLAAKYDANGDGAVSPGEYAREGGRFDGFDKDRDGRITRADFARDAGRSARPSREARQRDARARRVVGRFFQQDGDDGRLTRAEFEAAAGAYDADADGVLVHAEFRGASERKRVTLPDDDSDAVQRTMRDVEPWQALLETADVDGDGSLTRVELSALFAHHDRDDAGALTFAAPRAPPSGPAQGTPAPDFTLEPPEGGEPVRLSTFAGDRPVALVFGSYT